MSTKPSVDVERIPHYRVSADEIAQWLDQQGPNSWWSVDGDPYMMQRISLPTLSTELAEAFRKTHRWLILRDPRPESNANGETARADQLDELAFFNPCQDRVFALRWESDPIEAEWILVEDKDLSVLSQGLDEIDE